MKHITNFSSLAAVLIGVLFSFLTVSAQALQPIIIKPQPEVAVKDQELHLDIQSINDWRQAVEAGRTSDEELALSFYQLILSMEFHRLVGAPVLQGRLMPKESRIITKTVRIALENVNDSFSFWPFPSVWERRQAGLIWTLDCIASINKGFSDKNMNDCNETASDTQPLSSSKDGLQAGQSLIVFYRIGKFLESFDNSQSTIAFSQVFQNSEDGTYSARFIEKYFLRSKYLSRDHWDGTSVIGFFWPKGAGR